MMHYELIDSEKCFWNRQKLLYDMSNEMQNPNGCFSAYKVVDGSS